MRVMRVVGVLGAALLAACASQQPRESALAPQAGPGGTGSAPPAVNLAGTWQLDIRASGNALSGRGMNPMDGTRGSISDGTGGAGFGGGRPRGFPQGGTGGRAGRDSLQARDSLARDSLRAELGRLAIEQTDTSLTITLGREEPLLVHAGWRETRIQGRHGPGDVTFVTGRWDASRFEVRRALPSRTVIVERYELSREGSRLFVTTRIAEKSDERGEILPREGRRVYNRVVPPQ